MFWSGETILQQLRQNPDIISDFEESRIDCNSYTIRMGDSYYTTSEVEGDKSATTKLKEGETVVIPAGQFAFLLSNETIRVPTHVMGFLSMRTGFKFQGLINVSGFNVDPGYSGRLLFSVFNAGSLPVRISRNEKIFKIWFAELDNRATFKIFNKPGITEISNDLIRGAGKEILSLRSLSDKLDNLEIKLDKTFAEQKPLIDNLQLIWRTIIVGITIGIVVSIVKSAPVEPKPGPPNNPSISATPTR